MVFIWDLIMDALTLWDSSSSSERQTLYKKEWGSLANVVLVVAKMVPPTFNLTQEASDAKGGLWVGLASAVSILVFYKKRLGGKKAKTNEINLQKVCTKETEDLNQQIKLEHKNGSLKWILSTNQHWF